MAWYNASWLKRKAITLTGGSSGAQTDYQVKLTVTHDSDMKSDFSDLRFTKADGTTLLDVWLETKTDDTSAVIWVETDTPANTVDADIYMYYGNSGASSDWDGNATFMLFDDFDGTAIDTNKWEGANLPSVAGGKARFNVKSMASKSAYDFAQPCTTMVSLDIDAMRSDGYSTLSVHLMDRNSSIAHSGIGWYAEGPHDRYIAGVTSDWWAGVDKGAALGDSRHELTTIQPSQFNWKATGVRTFDDTRTETNNYPDCTTRYLNIGSGSSPADFSVYWLAIRKYAANPATYVFGSEESASTGAPRCRVLYGPFHGPLGGPI